MRQYLRLCERRYLHQGLVLVCLERTQCGLGQHGLRGQHGLQLLQRQWLSRDYGKRGGRHHAWRCQKNVGPWPQVLWDDKRRGAKRSWMSPMGPGSRLRSQGQAQGMGWPQGQLDPLYLSQRALGLPQCALYQNRAVAQARNVLVQQESALRRSSRKHARLRCCGVPDEQRTPRVEPHRGSALHRGRRLRRRYRRGPRCGLVLGRPGRLGPGGRRCRRRRHVRAAA
ncbi:hypothetical protein MRX96_045696 [Rhipicephalus microplus]